ncbi:MAG TPA: hypothetical protein VG964_01960 [Candidatus Saccharimonadales bacterium]|nr:hypothetical protein [Candidatus Saccharimonadales bacterium]
MNELARPDLLFPGELPYSAAQDPRPIFGSENITQRVPEQSPQTNLRFIYGVDEKVDEHALAEQIGGSEVVVYCSDWGSGRPDTRGLADTIEKEVRHFQDPDSPVDGVEIPDGIHPVIRTLVKEMRGAGKEFYCAGSFEPHEGINALDIAKSEAWSAVASSVAEYGAVEESIRLIDVYTTRVAEYNHAVEQRAYDQISAILRRHGGQQIAVVCQNSFPLLPRYFKGDEADPGLTMTRYHMPWARLISNLVRADDMSREKSAEQDKEYDTIEGLLRPAEMPPAHRPVMEQIVFLKQVGAEVEPDLYYNALYSLIANYVVAAGDLYGPDVEYRMVDRPHDAREQLELFEKAFWPEIRGDNGESEEVRSAALQKFITTWLRISI